MKRFKVSLTLALFVLILSAVLMLSVGAYTDTEHVAFVNSDYTVTETESGTQGKTAAFPYTKFADAYESLYGTGGTLVVVGRTELSEISAVTNESMHTSPIFITSLYEGVNYMETYDARLVIVGQFHCRGDVTFENIRFVTRLNAFLHGNGHRFIFGEGIEVSQGTVADKNYFTSRDANGNPIYLNSPQNLVIRSGGEGRNYTGGTYLEINSGIFSAIHCATKTKDIGENVEVVLNGGTFGSINLGNDVSRDSLGNTINGTIYGDIIVNINVPISVTLRINYIKEVKGSLNIALNDGAACSYTAMSVKPNGGIFCVKADGNGTVTALGNGDFDVKSVNGYIFFNETASAVGEYAFKSETVISPTAERTNISFFKRAAKPNPSYVWATPVSRTGLSDGGIENLNDFIEYRKKGETDFISVTGTSVTGLSEGLYEVRYKAEGGYPAGEIKTVEINDRSANNIVNTALESREERITEIRSTPSALKAEDYDIVYYVSMSGDDSNNGLSRSSAWRTLKNVNALKARTDGKSVLVLFERGGLWRERMTGVSGVDYSAYTNPNVSSTAKPTFYGSPENGADPSKWILYHEDTETGAKIWQYKSSTGSGGSFPETGVIVFNEGEENAVKMIPDYYNGTYYVRGTKGTEVFDVKTCLRNDLDFFNLYSAQSTVYIPNIGSATTLYLRCDRGNPGSVFDSIEFNTRGHGITHTANTTYDNLCVKYTGSHGFGGGAAENVVHQNCEVGWIGGVVQFYEKSTGGEFGTVTRFGNGIEVWQNCDGYVIDNCYVYQCYDAGITNQGRGVNTGTGAPILAYMKDVYFTNNVLEYNVYNIEYFLSVLASDPSEYEVKGYPFPMMTNIFYTDNLMYYAGYGFGKQRPNLGSTTHIRTGGANPSTNFHIERNLFFDAYDYCTLTLASKEEWLPEFDRNTFVQRRDYKFALHGVGGGSVSYFDDAAKTNIIYQVKDMNAEAIYLENPPSLTAYLCGNTVLIPNMSANESYSVDGGETWLSSDGTAVISLEELPITNVDDLEILARTDGSDDSYQSETVTVEIVEATIAVALPYTLVRSFGDSFISDTLTGFNSAGRAEIFCGGKSVLAIDESDALISMDDNGFAVIAFKAFLCGGKYTAVFTKNGYLPYTVNFTVLNESEALPTVFPVCGDIAEPFGKIDRADFRKIIEILNGSGTATELFAADLNEDGKLTSEDVAALKAGMLVN